LAIDIYFAPDTGDIANWGCRIMSTLYRRELTKAGGNIRWRSGSLMFSEKETGLPEPRSVDDLERIAMQVRRGELLPELKSFAPHIGLAFMNGENFIRPGARKGKLLLMFAWLLKVVFGRPVVLANLCLDLDEPGLPEMAAAVFSRVDEVQVRDARSAAVLDALMPGFKYQRVADIAWIVKPTPIDEWREQAKRPGHFDAWPDHAEGFDPTHPYITLCASSIFVRGTRPAVDYVPSFVRLCRRLQKEVAPVLLVAPCQVDAEILRHVQDELTLPMLGLHLPVRQAIDVLGNAAVHIGGRWHPGIFAASGGTPLVGFGANTHKMHSLIEQIGLDGPVFDPRALDDHIDTIIAQAIDWIAPGPLLRAAIEGKANELSRLACFGANFLDRLGIERQIG